ncbi:hypothetical protein PIROE2DRAFT_15423 [Piromyces sp. E2]|nr:hypothetical protein PIROE2DRAFT_15423 [Piromyces sp. E2]|eukprot:OUM59138.1 hypothetical protein PIROE2DRAFT_15423 [Piromyces sp. E2]
MKKYAKTIPKPLQMDAKNLIKEKISQTIDEQERQQQQQQQPQPLSSFITSAFDDDNDDEDVLFKSIEGMKEEEGNRGIKDDDKTLSLSSSRSIYSHIPIPTTAAAAKDKKKKKKKRDGTLLHPHQKKKNKSHLSPKTMKYSEIEKERIPYKGTEDTTITTTTTTTTTTTLPFSSDPLLGGMTSSLTSSNDPSSTSIEEALTAATDLNSFSPSSKKPDLVLPPISPEQLQLWNLEQEHRKAMDKVEHIKKELNL